MMTILGQMMRLPMKEQAQKVVQEKQHRRQKPAKSQKLRNQKPRKMKTVLFQAKICSMKCDLNNKIMRLKL